MNDELEPRPRRVPGINKADGKMINPKKSNRYLRTRKNRAERRAARRNPEIQPMYGKYLGWDA